MIRISESQKNYEAMKLILFDCDGTLVDSEYLNNLAMIKVLHGFGLTQYTIEYALQNFVGLRFSHIMKRVTKETGFTPPEHASRLYLDKVAELTGQYMKPIEGARDMVLAAQKRFETCVVSNGERNNVLSSLRFVGLDDLFEEDFIFTGLMAPNPKPAPDLFLLAAARKGIDPQQCLVIEDSCAGVQAGLAAGMTVWGFSGAHGDDAYVQALRDAGAHEVFGTMGAIQNALMSYS